MSIYKKYQTMTDIAQEMGYKNIVAVPTDKLEEFCDAITNVYGNKRSRMMVLRQLMYRKGTGSYKVKLREIWNILNKNRRISCRTK